MRIAMLTWESLHSIAVGGISAHVTELSAALERQGHEVHVFTRMAPGQRYHDWIDGVFYHRCPYVPHADFVEEVNNMCRVFVERVFIVEDMVGEFDYVHAHDWLAGNAMIWIKQGRGHKCAFTFHSTEYARCGNSFPNGRSTRVRDQERAAAYWADQVITVSEATKKEVEWMYEVPKDKIAVVYNGVSPHRFDIQVDVESVRKKHDIGPMDPTILFCGRMEWQKGPDILLEAIPSVLKYYNNAKFVYAGDGGMRALVENRAKQLGVTHAMRLLGYRDSNELPDIFQASDGICIPSRNEPFGIVVLEAWSAAKPVIATQVGGPNEFVDHEFTGLKITPNPDSVAWGVGTLFSDFQRASWMGKNGKQKVADHFTWDTVAAQTYTTYQI